MEQTTSKYNSMSKEELKKINFNRQIKNKI